MRCRSCGRPLETLTLCVRCRRPTCDDCRVDGLCPHCREVMESYRRDWEVWLGYVEERMAEIGAVVSSRPSCVVCPVLRELSLSLLKTAWEIEEAAERRGFEEVRERAERLRKGLFKVAGLILARQMAASRE
ncbi:MAG: hypothetical protein DRN96_08655 [Thermoproteota archaeon]|nr:MAG: hypothetical protein DRN96_08655 [Candidatus Korarchaeota archaeon]RLG55786.1 MAG: hypothetical protein DRN99_01675 [Candidatus Korarchaeota archaeon]